MSSDYATHWIKEMKTATITFHASHNYGSMLQAYSLQQTLIRMGVENEILNFRSTIQRGLIPFPLDFKNPRSVFSKLLKNPQKTIKEIRKYNRFERFLRERLILTPEFITGDEVGEWLKERKYDVVIAGSDQIWNLGCWDADPAYFLDFECGFPESIRKISFAPSLGECPEEFTAEERERIKRSVRKFNAVSTREKRGKEFLEDLGIENSLVADPVFLLGREEYLPLTGKRKITRPYIFYYTPRESDGFFEAALNVAKAKGLPIVVSQDNPKYKSEETEIIRITDCGPSEFLSLLAHSEMTIGNSFHLLAFSLIFEREFIILSKHNDSRLQNILEPLELMDRLQSPYTVQIPVTEMDMDKIKIWLLAKREESLNYLNNSLHKIC